MTTISRLFTRRWLNKFWTTVPESGKLLLSFRLSYVLSWQHHSIVIYLCVLKLMSCVRKVAWLFSWPPGFLQRLSLFNQLIRHITYRHAFFSKWIFINVLFSCCLANYKKIYFSLLTRKATEGYFSRAIYLTGFVKMWLKKFQVHFNNLISACKWNGKRLKVTEAKQWQLIADSRR